MKRRGQFAETYLGMVKLFAILSVLTAPLIALNLDWPLTSAGWRQLGLDLGVVALGVVATPLVLALVTVLIWKANWALTPAPKRARAEAIAALFEQAPAHELPALRRRWDAWLMQGYRAQGKGVLVGALLLAGAALAGALSQRTDYAVAGCIVCGMGVVLGVASIIAAGRRESRWRAANPFETWREDAGVKTAAEDPAEGRP